MLQKKYPETWHINDWHHPWLPAPIRLLNTMPDALARACFSLSEDSLFKTARKRTGLSDFGDEDFLAPFRLLLTDLHASDNFTPVGRLTARTMLLKQLQARLCVEDRVRRHPEIQTEEVRSPVIIAGLPRTGTTHLHNLLSEVSGLRFVPLWQTLEPVQNPRHKTDRRRQDCDFIFSMSHYVLPLLRRMHEMVTDMPHEELTLSALCYRSFVFEGAFQAPHYRAWYAQADHTTGYLYLKKILQIFQAEGPMLGKQADSRWVLKSPQHVDQLPAIVRAFPDARIVLTHRDPVRVVLSMVTMMLYISRQIYKPSRLHAEARAWVDRLEQMVRDSREHARHLPKGQVIDVYFDEFMKEPLRTIERVLAFADVEFDSKSRQAITDHLQHHPRDRYGRIEYRFEDFGLNEGELKERFREYQV